MAKAKLLGIADKLELAARREKMQLWLAAFASHGNITLACDESGVKRQTYYYWMNNCGDAERPNPEFSLVATDGSLVPFAEMVDVASNEAADRVEAEILRRAVAGYDEPVFGTLGTPEVIEDARGNEKTVVRKYTGQVGTVRKHSDLLLIFLAKALRPQKFRDNVKVEHEVNGKVEIDSARDRLAEKLLAAIERREQADSLQAALSGGQSSLDGHQNAGGRELAAPSPSVLDAEVVRSEPVESEKCKITRHGDAS
jgi:hypothetical protein